MKSNTKKTPQHTHIGMPVEVLRCGIVPNWLKLYMMMLRWQYRGVVKSTTPKLRARFEAVTGGPIDTRSFRKARARLVTSGLVKEVVTPTAQHPGEWHIIRDHDPAVYNALGWALPVVPPEPSKDPAPPVSVPEFKRPPASRHEPVFEEDDAVLDSAHPDTPSLTGSKWS